MPKGMDINQLLSQFGGMSGLSGGMGSLGGMSGGMSGLSSGLGGMSGGLGGAAGGLGGGGVSGNNFGGVKAGSNFGANSGMGLGGQGQGNFIGRNANQFVGMNAMTGAGMQGGAGLQNFNGGNRGGMNLNNLQNFNQNGGQQQLVPIRAQQRIAFDYPKVAAPAVQTQVQVRFNKLTAKFPALHGITFAADEAGVVVLSGEVKSASAAKLAEKLVRLEPGVKSVRSELTYPTE
jgi:hypothetical protein